MEGGSSLYISENDVYSDDYFVALEWPQVGSW